MFEIDQLIKDLQEAKDKCDENTSIIVAGLYGAEDWIREIYYDEERNILILETDLCTG